MRDKDNTVSATIVKQDQSPTMFHAANLHSHIAAWRTTSYNVEVETCKSLTYLDVKRSVSQISTLDKPYSNVEYNSYKLIFMQLIIYLNIQLKIREIFMYLFCHFIEQTFQ